MSWVFRKITSVTHSPLLGPWPCCPLREGLGAAEARLRLGVGAVIRSQASWTLAEGGGTVPVNPWDGERMDSAGEMAGARDGAVKFNPSRCLRAAGQPEALAWQVERTNLTLKQLKFKQVPGPKGCTTELPRPPQKRKHSKDSFH